MISTTDVLTASYGQTAIKGAATSEETTGLTMAEALAQAAAADPVDSDSMSPEAYRSYIENQISALPIHPSQSMASIAVHITDEGLEAMQKDPEYEAWVLGTLRYDFAFNDVWGPLCGGSYHVHTFGATKEDYHGEGWFPGYMDGKGQSLYDTRSSEATWKRNTSKGASSPSTNQYGELAARLRLERLLQKIALERRHFQTELLEHASEQRALVERMHRIGKAENLPSSPLPQFKGVSAAYLLAMLGTGL